MNQFRLLFLGGAGLGAALWTTLWLSPPNSESQISSPEQHHTRRELKANISVKELIADLNSSSLQIRFQAMRRLGRISNNDFPKALTLAAEANPKDNELNIAEALLFHEWSLSEPFGALDWAIKNIDLYKLPAAIHSIFEGWASTDPQSLILWAEHSPRTKERLFFRILEKRPPRPFPLNAEILNSLLGHLLNQDPYTALEAFERFEKFGISPQKADWKDQNYPGFVDRLATPGQLKQTLDLWRNHPKSNPYQALLKKWLELEPQSVEGSIYAKFIERPNHDLKHPLKQTFSKTLQAISTRPVEERGIFTNYAVQSTPIEDIDVTVHTLSTLSPADRQAGYIGLFDRFGHRLETAPSHWPLNAREIWKDLQSLGPISTQGDYYALNLWKKK